MRGKIKFFSTRPFELHRPRDHALLLLVLYTVYTFRGMFSLSLFLFLVTHSEALFRADRASLAITSDHFEKYSINHVSALLPFYLFLTLYLLDLFSYCYIVYINI